MWDKIKKECIKKKTDANNAEPNVKKLNDLQNGCAVKRDSKSETKSETKSSLTFGK